MKNIVKVIGTASWVPNTTITSRELMDALKTTKPSDWVEQRLGIRERRLAVTLPDLKWLKDEAPSCAIISERICRKVLRETGTDPEEIRHLILVTCTPDELHFKFTTTEIHRTLGLHRTARIHEIPSGCSGLIEAFDTAMAYLQGTYPIGSKILVVGVNLSAPFFCDRPRYVDQKEWLSGVIFADGACAILLQSEESEKEAGILKTFFEVDGSHPLMHYPAGGVLDPTMPNNVHRHLYAMNAKEVEEHYRAAMVRNFERLAEEISDFDIKSFRRIYLHQASPAAVEAFRLIAQLPEDQVPIKGRILGNPSAAVTGIMLDQDLREGVVRPGDRVLFSVVGAGAVNGAAVIAL